MVILNLWRYGGLGLKDYYQIIRHEGNRRLFQALEMSMAACCNNDSLHVHAEGLRGTGKTTIMRAVQSILPPITRIKGCIYNCDPQRPHCPLHANLLPVEIAEIGEESVPRPFLEISHSAKIGTVAGSIDLTRLTNPEYPIAALLPGSLPQAHRGIIFIDEINRLADTSPEVTDILLDVMGTKPGHIQVEEAGLPTVNLPLNVTVWAASNPDEDPGSLSVVRRQLSDRFDVSLTMGRPGCYSDVLAIMGKQHSIIDQNLSSSVAKLIACNIYDIGIDDNIKRILAEIYLDFNLESLRALEGLQKSAMLHAMINGKKDVSLDDLFEVVSLVLAHRADPSVVTAIMKYLQNMQASSLAAQPKEVAVKADRIAAGIEQNKLKKNFYDIIRNFLQRLTAKSKSDKTQTASNQKQPSGKSKANGSKSSSTNNTSEEKNSKDGFTTNSAAAALADPLQTIMISPPQLARPLSQLPVEQYVSGEEIKYNDKY